MFWNLKHSDSACPKIVFCSDARSQIRKPLGKPDSEDKTPKHAWWCLLHTAGSQACAACWWNYPNHLLCWATSRGNETLASLHEQCDHASSKTTSGKLSRNKGSKRECLGPLAFFRNRKQQTSDTSLQCGAPWQNPNPNMHVLNFFNNAAVNNTNLELWIERGSTLSNMIRHMQPINKRWSLGRAPFDYWGEQLIFNIINKSEVQNTRWKYGGISHVALRRVLVWEGIEGAVHSCSVQGYYSNSQVCSHCLERHDLTCLQFAKCCT